MKVFLCVMVMIVVVVGAPFVGFGDTSECYHDVAARAAAHFGIESTEYEISFISNILLNAAGEEVEGNMYARTENSSTYRQVYVIRVKTSVSRPLVIATIFHEMAHAAQEKYKLETNGYTDEQHAEMLAFDAMYQGNYWWNAMHMLYLHSFFLKPGEYLSPASLWYSTITGAPTVAFNPQR